MAGRPDATGIEERGGLCPVVGHITGYIKNSFRCYIRVLRMLDVSVRSVHLTPPTILSSDHSNVI